MNSEDFQKKVLEQLNKLDEGQKEINKRLENIEIKLDGIEERVLKNSEFIYNVVQVAKNTNVE